MFPTSLLQGDNATFLDDNWRRWSEDPSSVPPEWAGLFESMQDEPVNGARTTPPGPDRRSIFGGSESVSRASALRYARVVQLINAFRVRGHFKATIDPLQRRGEREHPELTLAYYGLGEDDLDVELPTAPLFGLPERASLRKVLAHLQATYCGPIGAEFMNIDDLNQKLWVQEQLETLPNREVLNREDELRVLRKLSDAENFENMLHRRFPGTKRFSLEGGETLIPLLDLLVAEAGAAGILEIVVGMAHRGRLNVLANIMEKPPNIIVSEFEDSKGPTQGSGDVKYHLGYSADLLTHRGDMVHMSLTPNPSHLEVVNSVVEGRTRAKQDRVGDTERGLSMPVLLHGDAAFIGQGSVAENLQLAELSGYRTGGTVHIIVNNQIGFTTAPKDSRSTPYATDVARMMAIPILHVNGEDPRAVGAVVQIGMAWRQKFHRDVIIDMYCYRKHGHNEGDEPSFTQPLMYESIRARPTPRENYASRLQEIGYTSAEDAQRIFDESRDAFDQAIADTDVEEPPPMRRMEALGDKGVDPDLAFYEESPSSTTNDAAEAPPSPLKGRWEAFTDGRIDEEVDTTVSRERLQELLVKANTLPEGFSAHNKVKRLVAQRLQVAHGERGFDWAMGEMAAFASLVTEEFRVRLSGQDSARGTFSHRHAVWTDIETGGEVFPLTQLSPQQHPFEVIDSNLSELAVLGFEYGYSLDTHDGLVLWEAQFGDFASGAQLIVDQCISSGERKGARLSGLVMLLPHGYEGQGPEHSSARLERYLLQCAEDNIQVANCSTPANYFHILRRQVVRHVRKPLVLMTPKSLLRHPRCTSSYEEFSEQPFRKVIPDPRGLDPAAIRRVVFCSGRVYYDLIADLEQRDDAHTIALHRVELLYPFPGPEARALIDEAPAGAELVWCQEEPRNMGCWMILSHWFEDYLPEGRRIRYAGRPVAASPATGSHSLHKQQQQALIDDALRPD